MPSEKKAPKKKTIGEASYLKTPKLKGADMSLEGEASKKALEHLKKRAMKYRF